MVDPSLGIEAVAGVREALSEEGLLRGGQAYPRVELEVLRVDRAAAGITAVGAEPALRSPVARGLRVRVVGRARIALGPDRSVQDTGDLFGEVTRESVGPGDEAALDLDATQLAARRLGRTIGRRLLGQPAPSE
jgi:hypothetical protein